VLTLLLNLLARSKWTQATTVVAGSSDAGAAQASVPSVGVGTASLYVGGHDR
jgi:hypothetical protein